MYCINICPLINSCQIRTQNQDQTKLMKHLIIQTEKEYLEGRVIKEVGHFTYCESYISQFSCMPPSGRSNQSQPLLAVRAILERSENCHDILNGSTRVTPLKKKNKTAEGDLLLLFLLSSRPNPH